MNQLDGYNLIHNGMQALADVEANGIHIDVGYCEDQILKLGVSIKNIQGRLVETDFVKDWRKKFGRTFKLSSDDQLGTMLYKEYELEAVKFTKKSTPTNPKPAVDAEALELLAPQLPVLKGISKMRKMLKCRNTYLAGILRETVDGYLHPFFNLHTVTTYRSSSNKPNFQNMPIRDPIMGKIIRQAIIPRPGRQIIEVDYGGIEVCIAACYHKDPRMLEYINDPTKDMHRDMAMQCYKLTLEQMGDVAEMPGKLVRYCGKNQFVFPEFYGDWYESCAKALWASVDAMHLKTANGVTVRNHLNTIRMDTLPKFIDHIQDVEDDFWNNRFTVYNDWRQRHYEAYQQRGWFDMKTGFRCSGVMGRNDVINYPVQGAAFHCLLWSLTRLNQWLKDNNMGTKIIGQIHDSIVMDVVPAEREEVLAQVHKIMCIDLVKEWDWIIVPLKVEAECTPVDGSWYEKKEMKIVAA